MLALAVAPAVRAVDEDPAAIAAHGQELEKQHRYAEAIAEYDKLVKRWPRSADPYTLRGWARHLAGDDLHGLADLETALASKPGDLRALNRRAAINQSLEYWWSAADDYASIVQKDPGNARAYRNLANCLMMDKKPAEALAAAEKAVELEPANPEALNLRGAIRKAGGNLAGALADCDAAIKLTKDERAIAALTKVREEMAAKLAAQQSPPPERTASSLLPQGRPVPETAATAPTAAPPAAPPPVSSFIPAARIDFQRLSRAAYRAAVSAAMEQTRIVLGPRNAAENSAFEKTWVHAFDFPCTEVVDYLNRLNPLLARFISLRATTVFLVGQFQGLWNEAMAATSVGNTTAADKLMGQVRRYGEQLKAAQADLAKTAEAIQALGDPPDAAKLKKRNRLQADAAIQYVHDIANGELITKLHECDSVLFKIRGRVSKRTKGNVPHAMAVTYDHTGIHPPPGSEDARAAMWRTDYSPYDWMETDNITLASNDQGYIFKARETSAGRVRMLNIDWYGPVFIGSLHVPFSFGSEGASSGTYGTDEATLAFCGVFSEDGQRLIDFYCIETTERREIWNGPTAPAPENLLNTRYLLHFEGDKVRHVDPLGSGFKDDIWYGASDQPKGEGEVPPPGETAALLRQYLARADTRVVGPNDQGKNVVTSDATDVLDVQLTGIEFRFFLEPQTRSDGASDFREYLQAGGAKEAYSSADELRTEFDNPDLKWATLVTPSSPKGSAEAKLGKMANLI